MLSFTVNQVLKIPCDVSGGAFPTEYLITVKTGDGSVSGFISKELVHITGGDNKGYILGRVIEVQPQHITVQLPGSFFTIAAGRTSVSSGWAREHLQPVAA